jgi:hypothetical protein
MGEIPKMAPQAEIRPEDRRLTFLLGFSEEEKISRNTLYRFKRSDPAFPKPRFGKRYWRPDLLAYMYGART